MNGLVAVLLKAIEQQSRTGYQLTQFIRQQKLWRASHQQVYRELNKLEKQGYLHHVIIVSEGKPDGKLYSLTMSGHSLLASTGSEKYRISRFSSIDVVAQFVGARSYLIDGLEVLDREIERIESDKLSSSEHWVLASLDLELNTRKLERGFIALALGE